MQQVEGQSSCTCFLKLLKKTTGRVRPPPPPASASPLRVYMHNYVYTVAACTLDYCILDRMHM